MSSLRNKIRFSIANKLSLVFFSVFILAVGLIFVVVVPQLENRLNEQKKAELERYAQLYSESYLGAYNQGASPIYLDLLAQQYAERADARILLIDSSGNLLADSLKGQAYDAADYEVAGRAIQSRNPATDVVRIGEKNYAMAAVPLFAMPTTQSGVSNQVSRVVVVSSSTSDVESAVKLVWLLMGIAASAALVLALVAIYAVSHILARRIQRIERGAKRISESDFATDLPVTSQDELGQLANTFNEMGERLGSAFQQIDVEKRRAKLLLDDLSEGVVGIDIEGNIIVANPAAEQLLGRSIKTPCPLTNCVPEEIYDLWSSMNPEHPNREDTFMLEDEQALSVHSSYLSDQAELSSLIVLRDVSQEVMMERSRRDFIANASHELKTPLFSLSGFLEILQDEEVDESTKKEFVATMREQVDRLAELAHNLLNLSQMDSGEVSLQTTSVELKDVIDSVAREFAAQSVSQDSRIVTDALPVDLVARCDQERTAQLVRILLDNALKYSPAGATVEVAGRSNGGSVSFTVSDSGQGIPRDELTRVFERFYRGKSAGRVRGTGLGLSIARELVRLMNGAIEVDSSGQGTVFTVTLPAGQSG
ncbi:MAG: ATP-binding protein [Thermoleophilia bacterium]